MKRIWIFLVISAMNSTLWAQESTTPAETAKNPWAHESEVSVVTVSGNASSETYSGKQKTTYQFANTSSLTVTGSYLRGKSSQTDKDTGAKTDSSLLKWDAALRYDHPLNERLGLYAAYGAESDVSAGYIQRDNSDLGAKATLVKTEQRSLLAELGDRYSKIYAGSATDGSPSVKYENFGRVYGEYSEKINPNVSCKIWVEYLPNFTASQRYLANAEASIAVVLTKLFSLKSAYLAKYHNEDLTTPFLEDHHWDTTFTTALVAKF